MGGGSAWAVLAYLWQHVTANRDDVWCASVVPHRDVHGEAVALLRDELPRVRAGRASVRGDRGLERAREDLLYVRRGGAAGARIGHVEDANRLCLRPPHEQVGAPDHSLGDAAALELHRELDAGGAVRAPGGDGYDERKIVVAPP